MHCKIVQIKVLVLQKHSVTTRTCTHGLIQLTQNQHNATHKAANYTRTRHIQTAETTVHNRTYAQVITRSKNEADSTAKFLRDMKISRTRHWPPTQALRTSEKEEVIRSTTLSQTFLLEYILLFTTVQILP